MTLTAYNLLCGMGAIVFASSLGNLRQSLLVTLGLLLGIVLFHSLQFPFLPITMLPEQTALLMVLLLCWQLPRPRPRLTLVMAGLLAALWMQGLQAQAVPFLASFTMPLLFVAGAMAAALAVPGFSNEALRREASLLLLVLSLALATLPEINAGWRSASALQQLDTAALAAANAEWSGLAVAAIALLAGFAYRGWKYR